MGGRRGGLGRQPQDVTGVRALGLGRCWFLLLGPWGHFLSAQGAVGGSKASGDRSPGASRVPAGVTGQGAWADRAVLCGGFHGLPGVRCVGPGRLQQPAVSSRWPPGLACEARGAVVSVQGPSPSAGPAGGSCFSPRHMAGPSEGAAAAGLGQGVGTSLGAGARAGGSLSGPGHEAGGPTGALLSTAGMVGSGQSGEGWRDLGARVWVGHAAHTLADTCSSRQL